MCADHRSSGQAGWTPPTRTTGLGCASQPRAAGHPGPFQRCCLLRPEPEHKETTEKQNTVPKGAGQAWGPAGRSPLPGSSPPRRQPGCGGPRRRLCPTLAEVFQNLPPTLPLHFLLPPRRQDPREEDARGQAGGARGGGPAGW